MYQTEILLSWHFNMWATLMDLTITASVIGALIGVFDMTTRHTRGYFSFRLPLCAMCLACSAINCSGCQACSAINCSGCPSNAYVIDQVSGQLN